MYPTCVSSKLCEFILNAGVHGENPWILPWSTGEIHCGGCWKPFAFSSRFAVVVMMESFQYLLQNTKCVQLSGCWSGKIDLCGTWIWWGCAQLLLKLSSGVFCLFVTFLFVCFHSFVRWSVAGAAADFWDEQCNKIGSDCEEPRWSARQWLQSVQKQKTWQVLFITSSAYPAEKPNR